MRYIFLHSDRKIRYNILDIVRKGSIENARKRVDDLYLDSSYSNIEYTDTLVRIQTKNGQIKVTGKRLQVAYYTNDEMKVNGHIESIEYQH